MFHLNACVFYSIRKSKRKICSLCYNNGPWLNAILIRDFNNCNNNTRIFLLPCLLLLILWLLVEVKIETNPFKVFLGTHFRHRTVSDPADFSCVHLFYIFWSLNTSYLDFWINYISFCCKNQFCSFKTDGFTNIFGHKSFLLWPSISLWRCVLWIALFFSPQSTMNPKIGFAMELYLFIDDVSSFLSHIVVLFGEACLAHLIKESVLVSTLSLNLYNWQADTKLIYTAHWLTGPHHATRDTHQHQQCQDTALRANNCSSPQKVHFIPYWC